MVAFSYVLMTLLMFSGLFLIGLVLLQRGRGGGLAGAFGGMGGQSAFGTKAGDVFTRITIGVATAWILLCAGSVVALHHASGGRTPDSSFKTEEPKGASKDSEVKAAPKGDEPAIGVGKDDPNTPPPAAPQGSTTPAGEKKVDEKPAEEKKAADSVPAKPEDSKPAEPAKPEAAPAEEKKPEPPKADEPKPADDAKKPAEPAAEPAEEKKPE